MGLFYFIVPLCGGDDQSNPVGIRLAQARTKNDRVSSCLYHDGSFDWYLVQYQLDLELLA